MYQHRDEIPDPTILDTMEFSNWPEEKQRLAQRVIMEAWRSLPYPRQGGDVPNLFPGKPC